MYAPGWKTSPTTIIRSGLREPKLTSKKVVALPLFGLKLEKNFDNLLNNFFSSFYKFRPLTNT